MPFPTVESQAIGDGIIAVQITADTPDEVQRLIDQRMAPPDGPHVWQSEFRNPRPISEPGPHYGRFRSRGYTVRGAR